MPETIEKADLILLLLAAPTEHKSLEFRCEGITRLEKLLFLLEQETDIKDEVDETFPFEAYHYGPYSKEVYEAVDLLSALRLIEERRIDTHSGFDLSEELEALDEFDLNEDEYIERQISLTKDGRDVARVLSKQISPSGKESLSKVKNDYGAIPLRQLLRYVYSRYPSYAAKSRIRDRL